MRHGCPVPPEQPSRGHARPNQSAPLLGAGGGTVRVDRLLRIAGELVLVLGRVNEVVTCQTARIVPLQQRLWLIVTAFGKFQDCVVVDC